MHLANIIRPGGIFVARIIELIKGDIKKVQLDHWFGYDICWWIQFIEQYNCVSIIQDIPWGDPDRLLATDTCLTGAGGFYQGHYYHCAYPQHIIKQWDINTLELFSLLLALSYGGICYKGRSLLFQWITPKLFRL